MYQLSQSIKVHDKVIRSISLNGDLLLAVSNDKKGVIYQLQNSKYEQCNQLTYFEKSLYASCNRIGGGFAIGHGAQIYIIDQLGNPQTILQGHENQVCSLYSISNDLLISGSWDATAIVWDISQNKQLFKLENHKHGVAVYGDSNLTFITGSQDGILKQWNGNTLVKEVIAHHDIIREIQKNYLGGYITCSNDETIKIWSQDLELLQTFHGHSGFIFTIKQQADTYISGGDDKKVIIWNQDGNIKQSISLPDTVWTLGINQQNDIIVGTSDGYVRVFTKDQNRIASKEELELFESQNQLINSQQEQSNMSQEEINKLPGIEQLQTFKGKKEGEIRLFKKGNKPEAYMWSNNQWTLIGDVIGGGGGNGNNNQKRQFQGDNYFPYGEYDHVFQVEDDNGITKLLPYNEGESFYETAEKFCLREGYSKHYLQQVINFLKANTSYGRQTQQQSNKKSQLELMKEQQQKEQQRIQKQQQISIEFEYIPFTISYYYEQMNLQGMSNKIQENNQLVQENVKLTEKEMLIFQKGIELLGQINTQNAVNIDFSVLQILINKLLNWDIQYILPIYDFLRIFCLHHSSEKLFTGLDKGINIFLNILTIANQSQNTVLIRLALQTLCNCLKQNANACAILYHLEIVKNIILTQLNTDSKIIPVIGNLILNLSIGIYQKQGLNDNASKLLTEVIIQFLNNNNSEFQAQLITSIGNLMRSPNENIRSQCKSLAYDYIQNLTIQTDHQPTIKCLQEVKQSLNM